VSTVALAGYYRGTAHPAVQIAKVVRAVLTRQFHEERVVLVGPADRVGRDPHEVRLVLGGSHGADRTGTNFNRGSDANTDETARNLLRLRGGPWRPTLPLHKSSGGFRATIYCGHTLFRPRARGKLRSRSARARGRRRGVGQSSGIGRRIASTATAVFTDIWNVLAPLGRRRLHGRIAQFNDSIHRNVL
jgi:hypothetical protein